MIEQIKVGPQPGPQTQFLSSSADIVIYGGAAGGGKTYGLLMEPLRHYNNPQFGGVIFRRTTTQIRNQGGLWDEAEKLYKLFGADMVSSSLNSTFPTKMRMKFAHLEYDKDVYDWQGSQIPYIGFDEITHFTQKQFDYMLSRNRSTSGVSGYIRATCNPDADSWVRKLIDWWIGEDGFPIRSKSGVLRWFIRQGDELIWANHKKELTDQYGIDNPPKSLTFIPSKLSDNKILMEKDPAYKSNLLALPRIERERLLEGNWNIRPQAGAYFQRYYFDVIEKPPANWTLAVRYWDRAATKPSETNKDPDWTVGLLMYGYDEGYWVIANIVRMRGGPLEVEKIVKTTAIQDSTDVRICIEQDPGSAGVADAQNYASLLRGFDVQIRKPTKDKITRALPVSAQAEARNIKVVKGVWLDDFFREVENFPEGHHDDQVDGLSGAFNEFTEDNTSILDAF